jgi:cell division protease FtsH
VARLLTQAEARATEILVAHRKELDQVAALLLERETIDGKELHAILEHSSIPAAVTQAAPTAQAAPTP